jgi:hypothetical protein
MNILIENNRKTNKDKVAFFKFLIYSTKAEIHINSFKDLLFWLSIFELFLFIISEMLFFSSPGTFYIFWAFITHLVRALLGICALNTIPDSFEALENLDKFDSSSIESLQNDLTSNYLQILQEKEKKFKPILITYFIFTIINMIVDNLVLFYLITKWEDKEYSVSNIFGLMITISFFGNF